MPRYKLTIAYDGTDFCGWQKQFPHADAVLPTAPRMEAEDEGGERSEESGVRSRESDGVGSSLLTPLSSPAPGRSRVELRTVQSVVERAVRHVVREPVVIFGASRTDSGVHARGQVGAFTTLESGAGRGWPPERGAEPLVRALNSRLPADVLVTGAEIVPDDFDPIGHAVRKAYSYTLWTGPVRPLFERRYAMHIWHELDAERMDAAARLFEGEHDFAGFAAAGHGRATTVRTVHACRVRRPAPHLVVLDIEGSGFLWNMVRIIGGTLVEIGKGKMPEGRIGEALASGDRTKAGPTLPPTGLCLEWIRYRAVAGGGG